MSGTRALNTVCMQGYPPAVAADTLYVSMRKQLPFAVTMKCPKNTCEGRNRDGIIEIPVTSIKMEAETRTSVWHITRYKEGTITLNPSVQKIRRCTGDCHFRIKKSVISFI